MKKSKPSAQIQSAIIKMFLGLVAVTLALAGAALGQTSSNTAPGRGASTEELQKATQNPVASLISVPFQNNVDENIGSYARDRNTLNVQPVIPMQIHKNWNVIPRVITPLIYQPFVSPGNPDLYAQKVIWGARPAVLLLTATDDSLGSGKWCIGPSVVALVQPGHFTIGALASKFWSFARSSRRADVDR